MAENKGTLDERVENEMAKIAALNGVVKGYDEAKKASEKAELINNAMSIILAGYDKNSQEYFNDRNLLMKELDCSDPAAYQKFLSKVDTTVDGIKKEYDENKDLIYQKIEEKLNSEISNVKNKADAAVALLPYFAPILETPEVTQEIADKLAVNEFAERTGMPYITKNHSGIGNLDQAKLLFYKNIIGTRYIKESNGKYSIDADKLKKLVENPVLGATLYTATQAKKKE